MIRFRIEGVDKDSGAEQVIEVEAPFERAAIDEASRRGLFVSKIVKVANHAEEVPTPSRSRETPGEPVKWTDKIPFAAERAEAKRFKQQQRMDARIVGSYVRLDRVSLRNLVACIAFGIVLGHVLTVMSVMALNEAVTMLNDIFGGPAGE